MNRPFLSAATIAALATALTACGPDRNDRSEAPAAAPTAMAGAGNEVAGATPLSGASGASIAASGASASASAPAPGDGATVSCRAQLGAAAAARLARQCRALSPATHPPCNVENSCAMIRSEIARSCSVADDGGKASPDCPAHPATAGAAVEAIRTYYDAIDARDYATAWQLWEGNGEGSGKSLDAFTAGFRQTVSSDVSTGTPGRIEGAAGSAYITVPVDVRARLADGTRQHFTGSYVLRRSNMERSQGWAIYSATLKRVG